MASDIGSDIGQLGQGLMLRGWPSGNVRITWEDGSVKVNCYSDSTLVRGCACVLDMSYVGR